jgi:hypothetical protein
MSIGHDMTVIAIECARTPGRISVWSGSLGRYVCSKEPEFQRVLAERSSGSKETFEPLGPAFKLILLIAAGGTLLFVAICVTATLLSGKDPPPLLQETIRSLFSLANIGFGAVCGLLGGRTLKV